MNRRRFLELLSSAALGSGIVYSFPSVIVSKNLALNLVSNEIEEFAFSGYKESEFNLITRTEIYPRLIDDLFFIDSPDIAYWRNKLHV